MVDAPGPVSRTLRAAPPDQLAEAADRAIRSALGATRTDVFIADYRINGLWPVLDPEPPSAGFLACEGWHSAASAASSRSTTPPATGGAGSTCRCRCGVSGSAC